MSLETFVEDLRWRRDDDEDRQREQEKLENMERTLYLIQEEIKGWDTETPENWANILSEIERFIKELDEL